MTLNAGWRVYQSRQAEIDQLNSVLDERTKEWLQAIECGTYFENVAKPLKTEIDQLKAELALCREENKGLVGKVSELKRHAEMLVSAAKSWTYSEGEKNILLSQADDLDRILNCEKALQGGDQNTRNKAQSIENTGHEGGDQKALRGEHG